MGKQAETELLCSGIEAVCFAFGYLLGTDKGAIGRALAACGCLHIGPCVIVIKVVALGIYAAVVHWFAPDSS